jgi:hypothetical protein
LPGHTCRVDREVAREAGGLAEVLRRDLMARGAGDAVCSEEIGARRARADRQVREDLPGPARRPGLELRHGHVTLGAFVLDGFAGQRMVEDLAAHRRLPVRIASRVRHHRSTPRGADRHVFTRGRDEPVVAGHARLRRLEQGPARGGDRSRAGEIRPHRRGDARQQRCGGDDRENEPLGHRDSLAHRPLHQPANRAPSNQSQST